MDMDHPELDYPLYTLFSIAVAWIGTQISTYYDLEVLFNRDRPPPYYLNQLEVEWLQNLN